DAERGLLPRGQGGFGQVEGLVLAIGRRRTEVAAVGPDLEERGLLTMRGLPGPPVGLQRDLPLLARREGGAVPDTALVEAVVVGIEHHAAPTRTLEGGRPLCRVGPQPAAVIEVGLCFRRL